MQKLKGSFQKNPQLLKITLKARLPRTTILVPLSKTPLKAQSLKKTPSVTKQSFHREMRTGVWYSLASTLPPQWLLKSQWTVQLRSSCSRSLRLTQAQPSLTGERLVIFYSRPARISRSLSSQARTATEIKSPRSSHHRSNYIVLRPTQPSPSKRPIKMSKLMKKQTSIAPR